jgi:hypothetical protein
MERRKFTREFKLEAVRLIKGRGVSYVQGPASHRIVLLPGCILHLVRRRDPSLSFREQRCVQNCSYCRIYAALIASSLAIDIPTVGIKAKERVDPIAIRACIETRRPDYAVIERAQAMPKQGASSGFKYGRSVGSLEAVIALCGIPRAEAVLIALTPIQGISASAEKVQPKAPMTSASQ